jgi:hypothetical protein
MLAAVDVVFRALAHRDSAQLKAASIHYLPVATTELRQFMNRTYQSFSWRVQARERVLPDSASAFDFLLRFEMPPRVPAAPPEVHRVILDRTAGPWRIRSVSEVRGQ